MAMVPRQSQSPLRGSLLPTAMLMKKDSSGRNGMMWAYRINGLPLHLVRGVHFHGPRGREHPQEDGQRHRRLGDREDDDEDGEDLPAHHPGEEEGKRHEVDVGGVQDQLDPHQHRHGVAAGHHGVEAAAEERGGDDEELVEGHPFPSSMSSFSGIARSGRESSAAPMSAASSSTDATSKGSRYRVISSSPMSAVVGR